MKYDWSKEHLQSTVNQANCWFNWLDLLGIRRGGYNYKTLKKKAELYSIDTSHFNYLYAKSYNGRRDANRVSNESLFSHSSHHNKDTIKREYILRVLGGNPHCEICEITNWLEKSIIFQLHHKDGDNKNNVVDNLQLLCPNCHTQTDNYGNRKR